MANALESYVNRILHKHLLVKVALYVENPYG